MDYELAKQLEDAGFSQKGNGLKIANPHAHSNVEVEIAYAPSLDELIAAVPKNIGKASFVLGSANQGTEWVACYFDFVTNRGSEFNESGGTPTEAVARLWLALNKHA
jgi:hypothetical protein